MIVFFILSLKSSFSANISILNVFKFMIDWRTKLEIFCNASGNRKFNACNFSFFINCLSKYFGQSIFLHYKKNRQDLPGPKFFENLKKVGKVFWGFEKYSLICHFRQIFSQKYSLRNLKKKFQERFLITCRVVWGTYVK